MTHDEKDFYYLDKLDEDELSISPPFENTIRIRGKEVSYRTRGVIMKFGESNPLKIDKQIETENGLEIHLKTTDNETQSIKAYFYEDSKGIQTLSVQRWMEKSGNPHKEYMTLYGEQLDILLKFVEALKGVPIEGQGSIKIPLSVALEKINKDNSNLDDSNVREYLSNNPSLIKNIVENEIEESDVIALSYRKKQLEEFEKLLNDKEYFELKVSGSKKEVVWQNFFEKNTWIFGYGLSYIFQTNLDDKKIEQVVKGYDFNSSGKRVDGLLKTSGLINSLCFVEIKTHETKLLHEEYRKNCWNISKELSGAISQIQNTVALSTQNIYGKIQVEDNQGNLTGEEVFNFHPKSFLVVGKLDEFRNEHGVNLHKYRSFELFRKNIVSPEIITFDELYERAKYIVANS
jgi:hypothetical protein